MTPTTTPMAAWLESAWLARYLDRQLSGEEAAWFEAYLLDKPELLGMVETDNELRNAIATERTALQSSSSPIGFGPEHDVASEGVARSARLGSPEWSALAASLVAGLGIGWAVSHTGMKTDAPYVIANPPHVIYDTMRGEVLPPHVEHAANSAPYVLIEVAVPAAAEKVVLRIDGQPPVSLMPSADGFVDFLVSRLERIDASRAMLEYELSGQLRSREIILPITEE